MMDYIEATIADQELSWLKQLALIFWSKKPMSQESYWSAMVA